MISCRSNGITPTSLPPYYDAYCANPPNKMTLNSNTIVPVHCTSRPRRDSGEDGSQRASCSLPVQALQEQGRDRGNVRYLFGSVYWCCCEKESDKNNNNMMTARLPPSRCSANICTRPAVWVEKMVDWILSIRAQTHPSVVCSYAFSPAQCILRIKTISPPMFSLADIDGLRFLCIGWSLFSSSSLCLCAKTVALNRHWKAQRQLWNLRHKYVTKLHSCSEICVACRPSSYVLIVSHSILVVCLEYDIKSSSCFTQTSRKCILKVLLIYRISEHSSILQ